LRVSVLFACAWGCGDGRGVCTCVRPWRCLVRLVFSCSYPRTLAHSQSRIYKDNPWTPLPVPAQSTHIHNHMRIHNTTTHTQDACKTTSWCSRNSTCVPSPTPTHPDTHMFTHHLTGRHAPHTRRRQTKPWQHIRRSKLLPSRMPRCVCLCVGVCCQYACRRVCVRDAH
jgi:hypothetical protein